jgi:hypothetical protein
MLRTGWPVPAVALLLVVCGGEAGGSRSVEAMSAPLTPQ